MARLIKENTYKTKRGDRKVAWLWLGREAGHAAAGPCMEEERSKMGVLFKLLSELKHDEAIWLAGRPAGRG